MTTYNGNVNKKCTYTARDVTNEVVCSPPRAILYNGIKDGNKVVAVLNERSAYKGPVYRQRYLQENVERDDDHTQEYTA